MPYSDKMAENKDIGDIIVLCNGVEYPFWETTWREFDVWLTGQHTCNLVWWDKGVQHVTTIVNDTTPAHQTSNNPNISGAFLRTLLTYHGMVNDNIGNHQMLLFYSRKITGLRQLKDATGNPLIRQGSIITHMIDWLEKYVADQYASAIEKI